MALGTSLGLALVVVLVLAACGGGEGQEGREGEGGGKEGSWGTVGDVGDGSGWEWGEGVVLGTPLVLALVVAPLMLGACGGREEGGSVT